MTNEERDAGHEYLTAVVVGNDAEIARLRAAWESALLEVTKQEKTIADLRSELVKWATMSSGYVAEVERLKADLEMWKADAAYATEITIEQKTTITALEIRVNDNAWWMDHQQKELDKCAAESVAVQKTIAALRAELAARESTMAGMRIRNDECEVYAEKLLNERRSQNLIIDALNTELAEHAETISALVAASLTMIRALENYREAPIMRAGPHPLSAGLGALRLAVVAATRAKGEGT